MIDLHVHSSKSDGTLTPSELVDKALIKGLSAFALTDHDTVDGLEEALTCGKKRGLRVIPGIELSTYYGEKEIHLVGLGIDYKNPALKEGLDAIIFEREQRNALMCQKLCDHGLTVTYDELKAANPGAVITRAHYGRMLKEKGFVSSINEAFERYIGDNCPCFIARKLITPFHAVELILKAGGIPVLAHPTLYHMSRAALGKLVSELKDCGLMGIEAYYTTYTAGESRHMREIARQFNLALSGGSDFHGTNKPKIDLGTGYGNLYVDDSIWENLENYAKNVIS